MTDSTPEQESAHVVLRGSFNPAILHPSWLVARDLISQEVAESAEVAVVSGDVTSFDLEWCSLQVTQDSFTASSTDPSRYLDLKDLVIGIFTFLEYTPLKMLGLNRRMHFKVNSEDRWHELGDCWAPKDGWKDMLVGHRADQLPGLRSLTMEGIREDSEAAYIRVKVEPSTRVKPGIYVETNEHYELADDSTVKPMEMVESAWADAQGFALEIATHLLKQGAK